MLAHLKFMIYRSNDFVYTIQNHILQFTLLIRFKNNDTFLTKPHLKKTIVLINLYFKFKRI